ncbi:MAG TPA: ATP-binding protein [Anaerolineaceae bacterium]|nr:ATP-binding protein [Anaerolineaceae bacterium]
MKLILSYVLHCFTGGEVTGVIEVLNKQKEDFSQEDVSLLESVAAIISVAMANAQLFAATRSRAEELETISQIGLTLTASLDFKGVVQNALFQIQQLFKAEGVSLLRLDEPTQDMVFIYALLGKKSREVTTRVSSEENRMIKWAVEHRDALLVRDTTRDPRFNEEASAILLGPPPASIMVTPMLTSTRVVGILLVASAEVDHFTEANLHTLQAISATLTVALENASLYENLKTLLHERELSQANIVQTSKMAALGQLSASIAHEINNPLQAMQGCLTLFSEEMNDACRKEKLEHYLHIVQSEIERITNIVSRMKDYYRPEREGIQTIHLHTSLETVLDLTFKKLQQNLIIVERKWADVPIQLQANEDRLKQVFLNLVLNALDAMPGGGVLTITTRQDRIDRKGALPVPAVRIEFKDTGAGMTPDVQANIFEPFFTTKESGSGLGLYVVYGIIQAHQGEIRVFSKPGLGTTFSILLPLEQV